MARIRSIKPEFWKSESIACHDMFTRLVFIGLWTYVDDNGVGLDNPKLVAAELFPLEDDFAGVSRDLRESLARLADAGRIRRYTVDGKAYLAIVNWSEHQKIDRPAKPRYPAPDDPRADTVKSFTRTNAVATPEFDEPSRECREDVATPHRLDQGTGDQGTGDQGTGATPKASLREGAPKRGTRLPDDFDVTAEMVAWARENHPHVNGGYETQKFRDYWRGRSGKDATKTDWIATWRNWIRKADENTRGRGVATGANRHTAQRHDNPFAEV